MLLAVGCNGGESQTNQRQEVMADESRSVEQSLIVYSGRKESLVGEVVEMFKKETGIDVQVKYGDTAQLAALLMEEKDKSPADVYFAQDAGALGAVSNAGLFAELPSETTGKVEAGFRSVKDEWVGVTGRNRVVVYSKEKLSEADLPADIFGFCDQKWKGKLGWAPTNGSFQSFVTALRMIEGEEKAREWLECIKANEAKVYPKNTPIVAAAAAGEIEAGFVNHYYLHRFLSEEGDDFGAANDYPTAGDAGSLVNVAGVGILKSAKNAAAAQQFVEFMLSEKAQSYFAQETHEYPLISGVAIDPRLMPITEVQKPDLDLSKLEDLQGTLDLLHELEIL